jgi:pseudouridine synthase
MIDGRRTAPAEIKLLPARRPTKEAVLQLTVHEGRNRQVRRMCEAVGHPVTQLRRVAIGPVRDARLKPGEWRELTADEVRRLREL